MADLLVLAQATTGGQADDGGGVDLATVIGGIGLVVAIGGAVFATRHQLWQKRREEERAATNIEIGAGERRSMSQPHEAFVIGETVHAEHVLTVRVINRGERPEYVYRVYLEAKDSPFQVVVRSGRGSHEVKARDHAEFELELVPRSQVFPWAESFQVVVELVDGQTFRSPFASLAAEPEHGVESVVPDPDAIPDDEVATLRRGPDGRAEVIPPKVVTRRTSEVVRWGLLRLPKEGSVIVLVVDDDDDDELADAISAQGTVPSEQFGGLWGSGQRDDHWLVGFRLVELGGGIERDWFMANIHRELLDAVLDVPHLVAIVPEWAVGDADTADALIPLLSNALFVEVDEHSPQVAEILAERDE